MTKQNLTEQAAAQVALDTIDAYSFERYAPGEWVKAAKALAKRGHDARAIEAVLRSKWMRWAADAAGRGNLRRQTVNIIENLKAELEILDRQYELAIHHAISLLEQGAGRVTTHLGHNLANRATDLSVIAGKREEVAAILSTLETIAKAQQ